MTDSVTDPLSWKGYSARQFMSLDLGIADLAKHYSIYDKLPMLNDSVSALAGLDPILCEAMQKVMLDRTGHSAGIMVYFGMLPAKTSRWLREQVSHCVESLFFFARTFLVETTGGPTIDKLLKALDPLRALRLRSVLGTSKYNYPSFRPNVAFTSLAKLYPLFLETGVDLMCNGDDFIFSEAQIRYNAPRPYLLPAMKSACLDLWHHFFNNNPVEEDNFETSKLSMLQRAYKMYSGNDAKTAKIVIDAWTYENNGSNDKEIAKKLDADYILFDDIFRNANPYQTRYSGADKLFVLNHPPLNLLCPDSDFLSSINDEHLEEYDDLAWNELFEDHMNGRVFLSNPLCTDILNDKALYEFLPDFARVFLSKEIELPVISSKELWDYNDSSKINEEIVEWCISNQSEAVIAHRYLEGGMGIRVGRWCDKSEWISFIDNFVRPRPYLFVVRPYFAMSPACSLRLLACGLVDPAESRWNPEMSVGKDMFGRISLEEHVTSESARCYLVVSRK